MNSTRPQSDHSPAQRIRDLADQMGFALISFAPARPTDHADYVRRWLAKGKHGEMSYLADTIEKRLDPSKLLPGARTVICAADRYAAACQPPWAGRKKEVAATGKPSGRIARYAWGEDYHKVIKKRLHRMADGLRSHWPSHQYHVSVDTAPVLERDHAQRAGLGWMGKHTLLIHRTLGSWLLLGQIITTLEVNADEPMPTMADHCGTCTRCIDACPTGCITPYQLDASCCISYLTIEHRGTIDVSLQPSMGDWIAGCDVCQEVCPFNQAAAKSEVLTTERASNPMPAIDPAYEPRPPSPAISLLELLGWDAEARRRAFTGSALKRIKLDQLKRNAVIAAGNHLAHHEDGALHRRIEELARDPGESQLVRDTAHQVLARLAAGPQLT